MSKYKVSNYIAKKWEDISKETPMYKAYELGIAQGMAWSYENLKSATDKETADKIWRNYLDGTDELCTIFRTIVNLSNDDTNSKIEKLMDNSSLQGAIITLPSLVIMFLIVIILKYIKDDILKFKVGS